MWSLYFWRSNRRFLLCSRSWLRNFVRVLIIRIFFFAIAGQLIRFCVGGLFWISCLIFVVWVGLMFSL